MNNHTYVNGKQMLIARITYRDGSSMLALFDNLNKEKSEFLRSSPEAKDIRPANLSQAERQEFTKYRMR